jgi:DNA modification methylase
MSSQIINADARHIPLPNCSVQCVVTSPPYFGLRDYGVNGQIGLEQSPAEYVAQLVLVFNEVRRVLRDDGVCWLNIGDSYASTSTYNAPRTSAGEFGRVQSSQQPTCGTPDGFKPKDLLGIPWRVAFALQDAGWYLRSDIIWSKPNPMPESVTDRPTKAHEYVFLLTKLARYFYDAKAVAELALNGGEVVQLGEKSFSRGQAAGAGIAASGNGTKDAYTVKNTRNLRSVWQIATQPYSGAHFATMPPELARRCIKAGSKAGDMILDPFSGSGTTGKVALELGRRYIGLELNPAYIELSQERQTVTMGMGW